MIPICNTDSDDFNISCIDGVYIHFYSFLPQVLPRGLAMLFLPSALSSPPVRTLKYESSLLLPWRSLQSASVTGTRRGSSLCGVPWLQPFRTVTTSMIS